MVNGAVRHYVDEQACSGFIWFNKKWILTCSRCGNNVLFQSKNEGKLDRNTLKRNKLIVINRQRISDGNPSEISVKLQMTCCPPPVPQRAK